MRKANISITAIGTLALIASSALPAVGDDEATDSLQAPDVAAVPVVRPGAYGSDVVQLPPILAGRFRDAFDDGPTQRAVDPVESIQLPGILAGRFRDVFYHAERPRRPADERLASVVQDG